MNDAEHVNGQTGSALSDAWESATPQSSAPIAQVEHIKLHGDLSSYCGHPRSCGMFNFGNGELVVLHWHAPCAYRETADVRHDYGGVHSRSVVLLQRSLDSGRTWPASNELIVWNEAAPREDRLDIAMSSLTSPRETIDLSRPESAVWVARTYLGPDRFGAYRIIAFSFRSPDKGRTWEAVPTLILPPPGCHSSAPDNTPLVHLPDRTILLPMRSFGGRKTSLYASADDGLSWHFQTHICDMPDYPALVLLKTGRLQCYTYPIGMSYSDDLGKTWSQREPILPAEPSPWATIDPVYRNEWAHRSPVPLLLRDGRIIMTFARRISPGLGIGVMISEDEGKSWSPDYILRSDAAPSSTMTISGASHDYSDIGYPLATELEDGRVFTAYYYMVRDGNGFGGTRFIAGTFFSII